MRQQLAAILAEIESADIDYRARYGFVLDALNIAHRIGYPAGIGWDHTSGPDFDGFRAVVYILLPTGLVSWHMPEFDYPYDGHSTEEKYKRCRAFRAQVA